MTDLEAKPIGRGCTDSTSVVWHQVSRGWLGEYRFAAVPPESLEIRFADNGRPGPTSHATHFGPGSGVDFLIHDTLEWIGWQIIAEDSISGARDREFRVLVFHDGGWVQTSSIDGCGIQIASPRAPTEVAEMLFSGVGYRAVRRLPVLGELRSHAQLATVKLDPGFGAILWCTDPDGIPIAGLRVLLDDQPSTATDAKGIALVSRESAPLQIAFDARQLADSGWTSATGEAQEWTAASLAAARGFKRITLTRR